MNRDLTVNLRIVTAGGENSRAAGDAINAVTEAANAATAATNAMSNAHSTASTAASTLANASRSVGESVASSGRGMRQAADSAREYATVTDRLDAKFAELEEGLKEVNNYFDQLDESRKRLAASDQKFLSGIKETISGVTSLARSVVLLVAANEDQASSMLKVIARFESAAQAIKGVISIVNGATKAWNAYTAAAATAGSIASGGSLFGSIATGAGTLGGMVLDLGLIGVAAPFIGGASMGLGGASITNNVIMSLLGSDTTGATNQGFGTMQVPEWDMLTGFLSSTWRARSSAQASAAGVARMQQQLAEREEMNTRISNQRMRDQRIGRSLFETDTEQTMFLAGLQDPLRNPTWRDGFDQQIRLNNAQIQAVKNRVSSSDLVITNKDNALSAESKREEAIQLGKTLNELTRERVQIMQRELETANRIVASQRENLVQMSRGDTRNLANAIRAAENGEQLTSQQIALLRRNNIIGLEEQIKTSSEQLIRKDANAQYILEHQQDKSNVDNLTRNYNIAVNSEMVLKVQAEIDNQAPEWLSQSMNFINQQVERIKQEAADLIKRQFDIEAARNDRNNRARDNTVDRGNIVPMM